MADGVRRYSKATSAKATVGEVSAIASSAAMPATVAARFAITMSALSLIVASIALAVAVTR